jgi:HEAT repeat protein
MYNVIGLGLRPLQDALNRKADEVQREFIALGERIEDIGKQLLEVRGEEHQELREEQKTVRAQQIQIAEEVNVWRDRARSVMHQPGKESLRAYLHELLELDESELVPAIEQVLHILDLTQEELIKYEEKSEPELRTVAGRLLERARTEYDMRGSDPGIRQREAVGFANRPGMYQDDAALDEIAAAMEDPDPIVREVAILTTIQLHRFRALQMADLDVAHDSVQYLARLDHEAVIPTLIEILENPRSGFLQGEEGPTESDNGRSRMVALLKLVEWHTGEAQSAISARKFDRDPHIVRAAERALELFPDPWSGPLKGKGPLRKDFG